MTEDQEKRLDARAKANGVSRSAYVRWIIDRALQEPEPLRADVRAQLGEIADTYHEVVGGLFDSEPDLRIDL